MSSSDKTGSEQIDEIAKAPNLDKFFDKNPRELSNDDLRELIQIERERRALFIDKKGK